jgi:hypothetical protein
MIFNSHPLCQILIVFNQVDNPKKVFQVEILLFLLIQQVKKLFNLAFIQVAFVSNIKQGLEFRKFQLHRAMKLITTPGLLILVHTEKAREQGFALLDPIRNDQFTPVVLVISLVKCFKYSKSFEHDSYGYRDDQEDVDDQEGDKVEQIKSRMFY